jgi:hypothetical protein
MIMSAMGVGPEASATVSDNATIAVINGKIRLII